jgi:hypothetical protein
LTVSLAALMEQSLEIAWNYLQRTGEIEPGQPAIDFLTKDIADRIRRGERSRLLLANRAIRAYQQHKADRVIELVR